jgi:lipoprotein-anchoring transpeptidase ErfK/SrfK
VLALCWALLVALTVFTVERDTRTESETTTTAPVGPAAADPPATTTTAAAADPPARVTTATSPTTTAEAPPTTAAAPTTTAAAPTTTTAPPLIRPDGLVIRPSYKVVYAIDLVHVLDAPSGAILQTLEFTNELGVRTTLPVMALTESWGAQNWYEVGLRLRPNGVTGWVSSDEVTEGWVTTAIVVELEAHRLTLYDRAVEVAEYPVGVGTTTNPTPTGTFFVLGVLDDPGGAYGPYAIGTSALSETLTDWPGGGTVGIHGTSNPSSVGQDASHGCIRLYDSDITQLAGAVRPGTPVFIVP